MRTCLFPLAAWYTHALAGAVLIVFALLLAMACGYFDAWNRRRDRRRLEREQEQFNDWHRRFLDRQDPRKK